MKKKDYELEADKAAAILLGHEPIVAENETTGRKEVKIKQNDNEMLFSLYNPVIRDTFVTVLGVRFGIAVVPQFGIDEDGNKRTTGRWTNLSFGTPIETFDSYIEAIQDAAFVLYDELIKEND